MDNLAAPKNSSPKIPAGPILSTSDFFGGSDTNQNLLDMGTPLFLTSGRMALALALELAKTRSGDEVLIPAYHCSSMVAPVVHAGASPVFYKIQANMLISMNHIECLITNNTKALLVTHYFGFAQPLEKLRNFCDTHNLLLIEDCAHSIFGTVGGQPLGSYGDYAIGSLMKFYPVFDGGCLVSKHNNLDSQLLDSAGRGFELQSSLNILELSFKYKRLALLSLLLNIPLAIKKTIWARIKNRRKQSGQDLPVTPTASQGGFDFDPSWIHKSMSASSRFILRYVSTNKIIQTRLKNYAFLSKHLSKTDQYMPLHTTLPENTVPYVFPLLITDEDLNVDEIFYGLRREGVPLLRWECLWDGVDTNTCAISANYSRRLIQVPCHQSFKQDELEWMVEKIKHWFYSPTRVR